MSKTAGGVTTNYHYDGDHVLYETDENNQITAEYTYNESGQPVTMTRNGQTYYYVLNYRGDVMALTDASGTIVASYTYDAYGNILSQSGALAEINPYRYASYRYDEETGLYYLLARYYHPDRGSFLSLDPHPGALDDPVTQNGYAYAKNNPVMYVDPDGHMAFKAIKTSYGYRFELWLNNKETKRFVKGLRYAGIAVNGIGPIASKLGIPVQVLVSIAAAAGSMKISSMADYVEKKNKGRGVIINYGKYFSSKYYKKAKADKTPIVRSR